MSKICLIRQPAGIGDIFFCQKIAKLYANNGYQVIWPVLNEFSSIKDYIKHPNIFFVNENEDFPLKNLYQGGGTDVIQIDGNIYLPIQHFDRHYPNQSVMYSKYKKLNIDYSDWVNFFDFQRNITKEDELKKIMNVSGDYNFVNRQYGSPPHSQNCIHMTDYENSIEMKYVEGYTIFDWIGIILGAKHIYTAETSLLYILKKLGLTNVTVYSKHNPPNYFHVSELFPKEWNYIL